MLCGAKEVVWCDGSEEEKERLTRLAIQSGEVEALDPVKWPGCLYARSTENDVARVEQLTYICTRSKEDAGNTNNWMDPKEAYQKLSEIFKGSMKGRTMYVVPYIMGIPKSPFNKIGIEITDSIYVVLNMRIMTRMGKVALQELGAEGKFTRGLHGKADLDDHHRFIYGAAGLRGLSFLHRPALISSSADEAMARYPASRAPPGERWDRA